MFSLPLLCLSFCHCLVLFSSAYHIRATASGVPVSRSHVRRGEHSLWDTSRHTHTHTHTVLTAIRRRRDGIWQQTGVRVSARFVGVYVLFLPGILLQWPPLCCVSAGGGGGENEGGREESTRWMERSRKGMGNVGVGGKRCANTKSSIDPLLSSTLTP